MSALQRPVARQERRLLVLAAAFVALGALTLCLALPSSNPLEIFLLVFSFAIAFATAHVTLCRHLPNRDPLLLPTAAMLSGLGLLMLGRLAPNFSRRQATWLLVAVIAMFTVVQWGRDLRWLRRYRYTWLLAGMALLLATLLFGVNPSGQGPRLWLPIGGAYFQPSEPLKLLMTVYLASYLAERRELLLATDLRVGKVRLPPLAYVGPLLVMFGLTLLLLAWQQDLGTGMLFFFTFLTMLYLATGQWGYVAAGFALFAIAGWAGYSLSTHVALRVDGWLNPWPNAAGQTFQIVQSLLAFGAGGIGGQGLGLGRPTYIPAVHTDFIFAAVVEEFGLAGALALVALYGVLLMRGFRAALRAAQPFERFLAAGLTAGLVIQGWVIMAANAKLVPITGVTLPFLSYGGSSLLATFIVLGLLLRISSPGSRAPGPRVTARGPRSTEPLLLRVACGLGVALAVLAAVCGYWAVAHADALAAREDNPRRVEYEQRIVRGRIVDRAGTVLADVEIDASGIVTRTYPLLEAAPVVGYASLRYGTGGIEAAFDGVLRGEAGRSAWETAWAELLHRPPHGSDVQLTLDARLQQLAQQSLGEGPGALVLVDGQTGQVLAMASAPTFDPGRLDEEWDQLRQNADAPLFNRVTQGLYQPGTALETVVLAQALELGLVHMTDTVAALAVPVPVDGVELSCVETPPASGDWAAAYRAACPGPFAALGEQLGAEGLREAVARWGLLEAPALELPAETGEWSPQDPALEAVGQGSLTVSPLQMVRVAATLAGGGRVPTLRLVAPGETAGPAPGGAQQVIEPELVQAILAAWQLYGADILGHCGVAVAGEGRPPHAWFVGVSPAEAPRYAVAVLIEHPLDAERAAEVAVSLLAAISPLP
ncbi:MAG: FtsW/RodA/SpoVE family cell cycle protein [Anaerolineae bacterium]|nr:FtsW/RodA/SpoVE family cell cycle protein [Anaerolineae bacterium]